VVRSPEAAKVIESLGAKSIITSFSTGDQDKSKPLAFFANSEELLKAAEGTDVFM
jgi:hypothetical protein